MVDIHYTTTQQVPSCHMLYRGPCHPSMCALIGHKTPLLLRPCSKAPKKASRLITRALKKKKTDLVVPDPSAYELRPWTFMVPSVHDIVADPKNWPERVKNWQVFWAMVNNWVHTLYTFVNHAEGKLTGFVSLEQAEWLQLFPRDAEKLEEAIDLVVERIPDLKERGVPMTDSIPGKDWNVGIVETAVGHDERGRPFEYTKEVRSSSPLYQRSRPPKPQPKPMEPPPVRRVWDDWQEGDFRAYEEKQRKHRQQLADFAQRQAELGKFQYLDVSPLTDRRYRTTSTFTAPDFEPREYTHEEIMQVVTKFGTAVHPERVGVRILDPEERADYFQEGVHWVPNMLDFIDSTGHLLASEEELVGPQIDNYPSATLQEDFEGLEGDGQGLESGLEKGMSLGSEAFEEADFEA